MIITVRDLSGAILERTKLKNTIVMVGRKMWRDLLKGDISDGQIKYLAVGSSATAITDAQTTLVAETFRKAFTDEEVPTDDSYKTICYVTPAEAVGWIRELGWFAGVGAGAGADTGIMIARILWSRNKTALESLQIDRLDSIVEG